MQTSLVRIVFTLEPDAWHGSATERLWAEPLGNVRFRLLNTPLHTFGVSNNDIVLGTTLGNEISFVRVVIRSGHSSYRLIVHNGDLRSHSFLNAWAPLAEMGCSYEEGPVVAVDVPGSADIHTVYRLLEAGADAGVWDFEEGHCGHPVRERGE